MTTSEKIAEVDKLHNYLGNNVYEVVASAFEPAEGLGAFSGNGHSVAQKIAMAVQNYFRERLNDEFKEKIPEKECWSNDLVLMEK